MKHVASVAGRELRGLFVSPVAYVVLALFSVAAGIFFFASTALFSEWVMRLTSYQAFDELARWNLNDQLIGQFYSSMSVILMLATPALTMGLLASEKTNGTEELLLTSPLTIWEIVLGKFVAVAFFTAALVTIIGLFPALLFVYGDPELGKTLSGLLGLLLISWTYVSIGLFASSLTRSLVIAFLLTFVFLIVMLILPALGQLGGASGSAELLTWISADTHLTQLVGGLIDTADLAYFAVMIGSFLVLTKASVESARWR
ncbi:MAG: ABC transporter permease [Deltaproteobacteria bacterium]|nr:ABC transporter permease [Deltaproteobacteria bacterium]MBW2361866.1 ABC transporter permease [Deltaproteobacteria bacterium]